MLARNFLCAHVCAIQPYVKRAAGALVTGALVALCLAGCDSSLPQKPAVSSQIQAVAGKTNDAPSTQSIPVQDAAATPVTIDKVGWWAKDSYVHYGVLVTNPNADYTAHNTKLHVILRDADGNVFWEGDDEIAYIGPGEQIGFAGDAGDGWTPAEVSVETDIASTEWYTAEGAYDPITIESCEEEDKLYFRYELTGEFSNNTPDYVSTVGLSALLLDDAGEIVAGYTGEAYKCKAGQTKPYLQTIHSAPDHAQVLLFAQVKD